MANVLGELFQDIANAIRSKTGATGSMKPMQFPDAIMDIDVGSGGVDTTDIDDVLDVINGEVVGETQYTVTFIGATGEELCQIPVYERDDCPDPIESGDIDRPAKASTKYYSYPFVGWARSEGGEADASALEYITGNRTVYAAFGAEKIYLASGDCGTAGKVITWTIDPDYVLELSGSGLTDSYYNGGATPTVSPWNAYKTQIKSLVVGEGITGIGMYNFDGCTALASVEFSSTVRQITHYSFRGCTALKSITIPMAVKYINQYAFDDCAVLTSVIFERTAGWTAEPAGSGADVPLAESIISDATTVAQYLTDTHTAYNWVNSNAT